MFMSHYATEVCKCPNWELAMAAFERDGKVIRSYTENSLTDQPKLSDAHVKRAESIISKSLESI